MLHETCSARSKPIIPYASDSKFLKVWLPTWNAFEQLSRVCVLKPCVNAPAVMIGFQVDPGDSCACVGRDSSGSPAFFEYKRSSCLSLIPSTHTDGSYDG